MINSLMVTVLLSMMMGRSCMLISRVGKRMEKGSCSFPRISTMLVTSLITSMMGEDNSNHLKYPTSANLETTSFKV